MVLGDFKTTWSVLVNTTPHMVAFGPQQSSDPPFLFNPFGKWCKGHETNNPCYQYLSVGIYVSLGISTFVLLSESKLQEMNFLHLDDLHCDLKGMVPPN